MPVPPLVAMIHANSTAARLAQEAFADRFPEAELWHLLDDRLLEQARIYGGVAGVPQRRMLGLIEHAFTGGADAVLLTCSAYGPIVETARSIWHLPVDRPDEAMFSSVVRGGFTRPAVLASVAPAVEPALAQIRDIAAREGVDIEPRAVLCKDAFLRGSEEEVVGLFLSELRGGDFDAVVLAQYSLAPYTHRLHELLGIPVFSGPHAAAARMREHLTPAPRNRERA